MDDRLEEEYEPPSCWVIFKQLIGCNQNTQEEQEIRARKFKVFAEKPIFHDIRGQVDVNLG